MTSSGATSEVLIVARAGRMLAQAAARAGYRAHVIDLFGDSDTAAVAAGCTVLAGVAGWCFDADELCAAVAAVVARHGVMPMVWGAGFERQPELLCALAQGLDIAGCDGATVFRIADPYAFDGVLRQLGIPHPEVSRGRPAAGRRWLRKTLGECGGAHVQEVVDDAFCGPRQYLQRHAPGVSMSVAFIADTRGVQILGFTRHLSLQHTPAAPYRYGGAVSCRPRDLSVARRVADYVARLAAHYGLRGLCGVDFTLAADGTASVLELNPRPTATFGLLTPPGAGFAAHMAAGLRGQRLYSRMLRAAAAHAVVYAEHGVRLDHAPDWPAWAADRPRPGTVVPAGAPLCTIGAVARNEAAAGRLLETRFSMLQTWLAAARVKDQPQGAGQCESGRNRHGRSDPI